MKNIWLNNLRLKWFLFVFIFTYICFMMIGCKDYTESAGRHSKRAEEYALDVEDYEEGSAKFHAFCNGFDAGWDLHSEEHNEDTARENGWDDGYSEGHFDGYNEGYDEGYDSGVDYVRYDDDDFKAEIVADAYHDVKQSFDDDYSTGLCDGYYDGYTDASEGRKGQYDLFDYNWLESFYENIEYQSGYEIGYTVGYRDWQSGREYDNSFEY